MKEFCREDFLPKGVNKAIVAVYENVCRNQGYWAPNINHWYRYLASIRGTAGWGLLNRYIEEIYHKEKEEDDNFTVSKEEAWDKISSLYMLAKNPVCAVYVLFSKDNKLIKIGSSENLLQRMNSYSGDSDFCDRGHGRGKAYYYPCSVESRYFMEDVLRAEVGQKEETLKAHEIDRFFFPCGTAEEFMEKYGDNLSMVLYWAQWYFETHKEERNLFEHWCLNERKQ